MNIVVASRNPVKINAVKQAFAEQFSSATIELTPIEVESGVRDQPESDEETRRGARNRVEAARHARPDADYWVGLEGGVESVDEHLVAFAWMVVAGKNNKVGEARSVTLPLPPTVKKLVADGVELGEANDQVFGTTNSKQQGGAFGLLTNGRYTREFIYSQTLVFALIPLVNEMYSDTRTIRD